MLLYAKLCLAGPAEATHTAAVQRPVAPPMSLNFANEVLGTPDQPKAGSVPSRPVQNLGPNGGNLDAEYTHPERRRASHNGVVDSDGLRRLHSLKKDHDVVTIGIQTEKPWHHMAAYMLLAGRTNSEVGQAAGVTPDAIQVLRGQRWFQDKLAIIANEQGSDILGLINSAAAQAVENLIDLANNGESEGVRFKANETLLAHAIGKPVQRIETQQMKPKMSVEDEMAGLLQDISALKAKQTVIDIP